MARETDLATTGAIPKVPRHLQQSVWLTTGEPPSALQLNRKTTTKKVTFNEIPIICETSKDSTNVTWANSHESRLQMQHQRILQVANNAAHLPLAMATNKNLGNVKTKKFQSKPPPVRKISRSKMITNFQTLPTSCVTSIPDNSNPGVITDNAFALPELHSSLHIAKRLQALHLETFNANKAVEGKLKSCKVTRRYLAEKSSRMVNIPPNELLFHNVTPLEFDEQALLTTAADVKKAKLKSVQPVMRQPDPEPDVNEFLTADMYPEFVSTTEPNYEFKTLKMPVKAPKSAAYHLYKHKRVWEGLP